MQHYYVGKRYYTLIVYFRLLFFKSYSPKKTYTMVLISITSKCLTVSCIPATIVLDICRVRFRYLSCLFQISVVFVSDICRVRFRYLSCSFQISVVFVLDICRVCFRYLWCLFQISVSWQLYILINICILNVATLQLFNALQLAL